MAKITDRQARTIRPDTSPITSGITGLTLQATPTTGRGKWNLRFVSPITGKRRDMGLGVYPDVGVADALASGEQARKLIAAGRDPIMERAAQHAIPTFEQAANDRWKVVAPSFRNTKHRTQWISSLQQHIFPSIGAIKVDTLTPQQFANALQPIWLDIPETAKRVKMRCADVMATCWAQGHIQANPLDVVTRLLPASTTPIGEQHQPAMPWRNVPSFVHTHLDAAPLLGARAALLFTILTAARSGEARGATWAEIDLSNRLWTAPAERMKAGRVHRVPLSTAALDLLRQQWVGETPPLPNELVFPALRRRDQLSDMALTSLLRKVKAPSDIPGRTATAHGFRSSFRDWAADHGYATELAERALAHVINNKVRAAYERTDRLEARRAMMEAWANHVMPGKTIKSMSSQQIA
ncbi:tyrosine-type recombinase/integrase [Alcaligenes aquatilis]|uniref:tyrosine-type recombinase/integrase n=1 Tax=Alcaligenes aquatilis TaxID=323284 RepID=UPI003751F8EF